MSSDSSVRSVERAIDVLFSFTQQEPVLDIPALQQRTGLSRPTLYRLLRTLESSGLIYSFGNPLRFQLGARIGLLASTWTPAPPLVTLGCRPAGAALAQHPGNRRADDTRLRFPTNVRL